MGFKWRTDFARAAEIKSVRSLEMLEAGQGGVGQSILFAVGRALPNWTEDTPRVILEGGAVPPTAAEQPEQDEEVPRDDFEREIVGDPDLTRRQRLRLLRRYRERQQPEPDPPGTLQVPPGNTGMEQSG